ncbi:hypothetical protein ACGYLO_11770 [Sulfitobacter sp. 1A13353]|uniref:hypothetical protein n=1 Tax=Sulfitobacter sp. 1A13353 TaxID=3368568 RepID=UPI0037467D67
MKKAFAALAMFASVSACSMPQEELKAYEFDPIVYGSLNCSEITAEAMIVQGKMLEIANAHEHNMATDMRIIATSMYLSTPEALLALGLFSKRAEFAQLKGQLDAIAAAGHNRKCDRELGYLEERLY